ncbi:hypothetical protein CLOL250_00106 [Clostridium sp. L2-50]|nr:hypothetical protein CLOL250_00106 [Clostridium sp. L2-50]
MGRADWWYPVCIFPCLYHEFCYLSDIAEAGDCFE